MFLVSKSQNQIGLALKLILTYALFIQSPSLINAQSIDRSIGITTQYGTVFPTNRFVTGANAENEPINRIRSLAIEYGRHTNGSEEWQKDYLLPVSGFGIYVAGLYEPELIGVPIALYGFFKGPFFRKKRFSIDYTGKVGAAFNWKRYNPVSNPDNIALGAGQSFYIDMGCSASHRFGKDWSVDLGFSLTHFSNGALKKPNYGINAFSPLLNVRKRIKRQVVDPTPFEELGKEKFKASNEFLLTFFGGAKNLIFDSLDVDVIAAYEGVYFPEFGLSGTYNRWISPKSKIGFGMGCGYDGAHDAIVAVEDGELEPVETPFIDKIRLSVFPSYELVVNKTSLIIQPGIYIFKPEGLNGVPKFFQRIGLRHSFLEDKMFIGASLRAYQYKTSDFMEWNVGYRFK